MIYEYRKVRTEAFGNEEEAVVAVLDAIPNSKIVNTKRIAKSGENPLFIFDLEVTVTKPKGKLEVKKDEADV